MAAFGWLGPLRSTLRHSALSFLRQLLATEEGKRILVDSLPARPAPDISRADLFLHPPERPYAELGRTVHSRPSKPVPTFITARFRTGSTLLWNLFRHVDGCTSYYEPLNERRWFDPKTRGSRVDATHVGADDYWTEYQGLSHLGHHYDERWTSHDLYLDRQAYAPGLRAYISALIDAAPERAVLQFNRVDFRLPWLCQQFPDARLVHLYRHPREQWCSTLVEPSRVPTTVTVRDFAGLDEFYLLRWATDLSYAFPFLKPDDAEHPYDLFYMIWKLSYAFGRAHADVSLSFEDLTATPSSEIPRLMSACGIEHYDAAALTRMIAAPAQEKWRGWASQDWFAEREAKVEAVLATYLTAPLRSARRAIEAKKIVASA